MASYEPAQIVSFKEPRRIQTQERILAGLAPIGSVLLAIVIYVNTREAGGVVAVVGVGLLTWLALMSTMGGALTLAVESDRVAIYSGLYGRRVTHSCWRAELSRIRVRKVLPFSILEFLRPDGSICLNTTTNWLTLDQLRQLSAALTIPIENLEQADVLSK
jgi:hypothetical protein